MNIFNKLKRGFGLFDEEADEQEASSKENGSTGSNAAAKNGAAKSGGHDTNGTGSLVKKTTENTAAQSKSQEEDYARFMPGYTAPEAAVKDNQATTTDGNGSQGATTEDNASQSAFASTSAKQPSTVAPADAEIPQAFQPKQPDAKSAAATAKASFVPGTPLKRDAIIGFILKALKPYVDEKGLSVRGLKFYMLCTTQEETEAARVALYLDKPDMFKQEHLERKLINHFIQLEPTWFFEPHIVKDALPEECIHEGSFGIQIIQAGDAVVTRASKARLLVMVGQAEQHEYQLDPAKKQKFYIGRSKSPQLPSGKIQLNDIVFVAKDEPGFNDAIGLANLHVSRNHAYIQYDARTDRFLLYPDKGGLPENGNKIKVHTADDRVKFLNLYGVAHHLQEGDQIELGGEAVLMFRYLH